MHIVDCLFPKLIKNPYTQEQMFVSCGKCYACQNKRSLNWVNKLKEEARNHRFVYFFNLDYSDEFVPNFKMVNGLLLEQQPRFFDKFVWYDVLIDPKDLYFETEADSDYFLDRCKHKDGVMHVSVRDIQLFKKRLNKYIHDKINKKYQTYRYFICSEYGETTHRPHYHGLLFFDDVRIAERFNEILSSCWSFGHCFGESCRDKEASCNYVAEYLNMYTELPSYYEDSRLRSFHLGSRKPPLGCYTQYFESEKEIVLSAAVSRLVVQKTDGIQKLVSVPLLRSVEDRLFPKIRAFDSLPHYGRVACYGLALQSDGKICKTFEEFVRSVISRIAPAAQFANHSVILPDGYISIVKNTLIARYIDLITDGLKNIGPLYRLYCISRKVLFNCMSFDISLDTYVERISTHYNKLKLVQLRCFYDYQEHEVDYPDEIPYMYLYDVFLRNRSTGDTFDYRFTNSYNKFFKDSMQKRVQNTKTKMKNVYFESKLKYKDFDLYNLIKNYHAKKCYEVGEAFA